MIEVAAMAAGQAGEKRMSKRGSEKIVVSACLAGVPCRYDGKASLIETVAKLVREGAAMAVCPEMLGGLACPRSPCEIVNGRVVDASGEDVTGAFEQGAREALRQAVAAGCVTAILKSRSPSCGSGMVYDGTFSGILVPGDGVFAALLKNNGMNVLSEEDFPAA